MFGSGWPVYTQSATLRKWVETLLDLTQVTSETGRNQLFYHNAARVYRLS